jgi:hypothetical protein
MKDTKHCKGCSDDFYNGNNDLGVRECWLLKRAKVVTRYKIGWWTQPTELGAFTKVKTYDCHKASGRYALYEELPDCAVGKQ